MARPTDLNKALAERVAEHVRNGSTLRAAAGVEGISWDTFKNWLRWGAEEREPYFMFFTLTRKAEAEAEVKFTEILRKNAEDRASVGDARWALAWLERRRREDWWLRPERAGEESKLSDTELVEVLEKQLELAKARIAAK